MQIFASCDQVINRHVSPSQRLIDPVGQTLEGLGKRGAQFDMEFFFAPEIYFDVIENFFE
jgi:hypothetical protein